MNREEILSEIEKTKQYLVNMEKMLEECNERWKPKSNEEKLRNIIEMVLMKYKTLLTK